MHETDIEGHLGARKLSELLFQRVWWKHLRRDCAHFVAACPVCARTKDSTSKPPGLLSPLPIPRRRFSSYTIDFMTNLPLTKEGYNALMTVVECVSKATKCIPCTMGDDYLSAAQVVQLFFPHNVRYYGVPDEIISDHNRRFTSSFWQHLWRLLGTKTLMSTAFHL